MRIGVPKGQSGLYAKQLKRRFSRGLALARLRFVPWPLSTPKRLLVAPSDLRASDAHVADDILNGRYPFAGRVLETEGASPFDFDLPSVTFANRLHSFGWLRDIRAAGGDEHRQAARRIVNDWIDVYGRSLKTIAWDPEIAAQRVIWWLSHSPVLLRDAELRFYRRFLKSIAFHIRFLRIMAPHAADGDIRLKCRIALALASLSLPTSAKKIRKAGIALDKELERQILPDGGHIARNPRTLLELLLLLLPLRQTYINLGHDVPMRLVPTIDRMFPALRFFRHQGGELALFNGATTTLANELASVLRYEETSDGAFKSLPHMQFQRLCAEQTVVLIDTGKALSDEMSRDAYAGALSFEMSSGRHRFIINSGAPLFAGENYRQMARTTAAHSAITVDDSSIYKFSDSEFLGPLVVGGLRTVKLKRDDTADGTQRLTARHDGYSTGRGLVVERDFQLSANGLQLRGRDRLLNTKGQDPSAQHKSQAVARFHIHPAIEIQVIDDSEVLLKAPGGDVWSFSCIDTDIVVADDVFFAHPSGIRLSQQLELSFNAAELPEIQWVMTSKSRGPDDE